MLRLKTLFRIEWFDIMLLFIDTATIFDDEHYTIQTTFISLCFFSFFFCSALCSYTFSTRFFLLLFIRFSDKYALSSWSSSSSIDKRCWAYFDSCCYCCCCCFFFDFRSSLPFSLFDCTNTRVALISLNVFLLSAKSQAQFIEKENRNGKERREKKHTLVSLNRNCIAFHFVCASVWTWFGIFITKFFLSFGLARSFIRLFGSFFRFVLFWLITIFYFIFFY